MGCVREIGTILEMVIVLEMVTFLGMVTKGHDHPEMKTMTVLEMATFLRMVTFLGMLAIIEYVWLRCMTLHDLILCYYRQQNLSAS